MNRLLKTNSKEGCYSYLLHLFEEYGQMDYYGCPVTQTMHGLQCAYYAQRNSASPALVIAALLHDIGHLIIAGKKHHNHLKTETDYRHEQVGVEFLQHFFPEAVTRPIQLHVEAKRYLCTVSDYISFLSEDSIHSMMLQGGEMSQKEIQDFENSGYAKQAIQLRIWDDQAKKPELIVPTFANYETLLMETMI